MTRSVLWTARHAPAAVANTCYGRAEVPVQLAAEAAAAGLARSFPGATTPAVVWSSPSLRCKLVAECLAARWRAEVRVDDALYELDFGAWEGRTWTEIERDDPAEYRAWMHEWQTRAPPRGERPGDLEARVRRWAARVARAGDHALVAHAGVVRALRVALEGLTWHEAMMLPVEHLTWRAFARATAEWV